MDTADGRLSGPAGTAARTGTEPRPGRQRDTTIDEAVMFVALEHLARHGVSGLSIAAVAAEAGTTRPAVYRRWKDKIDLLVAAVAWLAATDPPPVTGDPYVDLVAEMQHFRHCISDVGAISLAGIMLTDGVEAPIRTSYQEQIVGPRWRRARAALARAASQGLIRADADLDLAVSMLTGSWYGYAWSGRTPPSDWPRESVDAVWRSLGGTPPRRAPAASGPLESDAPVPGSGLPPASLRMPAR